MSGNLSYIRNIERKVTKYIMKKVSTFADRLKSQLQEKGLSSADLSRLTGIDRSLISHYIHGNKFPKIDNVRRIANVLYVCPEWLEGYNVDKTPKPVQLSPLENDLILTFRNCNAEEKYLILEFVKNKGGNNGNTNI